MSEKELLIKYKPLVLQVIKRMRQEIPCNVLSEDLYSAGMIGLWNALRKKELDFNKEYKQFLRHSIKWSIFKELRKQDWLPSSIRAQMRKSDQELKISVVKIEDMNDFEQESMLIDQNQIESKFDVKNLVNQIIGKVKNLTEREWFIINQLYIDDNTFKNIGIDLGISESRVKQLHKVILNKIKDRMLFDSIPD